MYKDSKIYIAGHTGLLGSAILKVLKEDKYTNIVVRTHKELDLTNISQVETFFEKEKPEYIFLCAGKVGGIIANKSFPADFLHINLAIQDNIFELANRYEVKNVVFYGSSCTYPKLCEQPMKEEYWLTGELEQTSLAYASAKISGIVACKSYNSQYNTNRFIALIPNSIYGINDNFDLENSHVLSALIKRFDDAKNNNLDKVTLWGSGTPRREFIFSEDIAKASIFAIKNSDKLKNRHYNIGSGVDYSIKELAECISKVIGYKAKIEWDTSKPDGTPKKLLGSSKFLNLGWNPKVEFMDGLNITYNWYKEKYGK